ncbi:hypothetical protein H632_c2492p0 [Helicosporidium sp. ATCC 50920]|nr:hypothetical protein H632_c2492p0 [Helicosporidium sp. ATCC 50920]|eukprot:KDD73141.1 hypothetical protein H632_c2492p0 [Helicosporidium sp. ATCC 50920]
MLQPPPPFLSVTKRLWRELSMDWTPESLAALPPQQSSTPRQPHATRVAYPFSTDATLREHYRGPWGGVRLGRILEDLDSLAGYVAWTHCSDGDARTRAPVCVTAAVEAMELAPAGKLHLDVDAEASGRVVWTGRTSLDLLMEFRQGGVRQLAAVFTFVARDALHNTPQPVSPLLLEEQLEAPPGGSSGEGLDSAGSLRALFRQRQAVADARKQARSSELPSPVPESDSVIDAAAATARRLLERANTLATLPALCGQRALLSPATEVRSAFVCQPQQRNIHGRVFGGLLMRRAYELAFVAAYQYAGAVPRSLGIDEVQFKHPVNVGDLIHFNARLLWGAASDSDPGRGCCHVQVQALVVQPEKVTSRVTNTFDFAFDFELGEGGGPKTVLPVTEEEALHVAKKYGDRCLE